MGDGPLPVRDAGVTSALSGVEHKLQKLADTVDHLRTNLAGKLKDVVDAEVKTRESLVGGLNSVAGAVHTTTAAVGAAATGIVNANERIREKVEESIDSIKEVRKEIESSYVRMVELQILDLMAQFEGSRARGEVLHERIAASTDRLAREARRLGSRFEALMTEIAEEVTQRINSLDSHVLRLLDEWFPGVVERGVRRHGEELARLAGFVPADAAEGRAVALEAGMSELLPPLRAFLQDRDALWSELEAQWLVADLAPGEYEVGFTLVEVEDRDTGLVSRKLTFDDVTGGRLPEDVRRTLLAAAEVRLGAQESFLLPADAKAIRALLVEQPGVDADEASEICSQAIKLKGEL